MMLFIGNLDSIIAHRSSGIMVSLGVVMMLFSGNVALRSFVKEFILHFVFSVFFFWYFSG